MIRHILTAAAVTAAGFAATVAEAQPVTLRFSSFEPPVAFITKEILTPWAERVGADSQGTLKVEMFPGGTLGRDPAGQLKLVIDGIADIAWIVPGYTPGRFDVSTVVELPFLVSSSFAGSVASWRMIETGVWKGGGFDEVKVLGAFTNSPVIVNTTFPAKTISDIKGKKFRAAGPVSLNLVKTLGGVPVGGITGPQIAETMSRGLVDGSLNEWNALQTFRLLEVAKNHIVVPMGATSLMVVMNKAKYDGLPAAAKAALDKHAGAAFSKAFGKKFDANNDAVFAKARGEGKRTVLIPAPAEVAAWRAAVAPVTADWIKSRPDGEAAYKAFADAVAATVGAN